MNIEYRTQVSRTLTVVLILAATVLAVMITAMSLTAVAYGWSERAILAAVVAILVAGFGGMFVLVRRFGARDVVYTASERGLREAVQGRGEAARTLEVAWSEVREYAAGEQLSSGLEFLRLRLGREVVTILSREGDGAKATFARFRDEVVSALQAHGVREARPSAARRTGARALGWGLLALVVAAPVYALSLPAQDRPEMWWLRWLMLVALATPFIGRALSARR